MTIILVESLNMMQSIIATIILIFIFSLIIGFIIGLIISIIIRKINEAKYERRMISTLGQQYILNKIYGTHKIITK